MMHLSKCRVAFVGIALILCVFAITKECSGKPFDIYDEIVGNDEKQLLQRMAELIDTISGDDSDNNSGRLTNSSAGSDSTSNELKDMKPGERCILPVRKGFCRALIPRYSYDPIAKDCKEFKFGGCDGNGNNFTSRKQCLEFCKGI